MNNLKQYEKDERQRLRNLIEQMNILHAEMGGRDSRPERKVLMRCMNLLKKEIERASQND